MPSRTLPALLLLLLAVPARAADGAAPPRALGIAELGRALSAPAAERAFTLLDVRSVEEYDEMHLPGALSLPATEVAEGLPRLVPDRARALVFYCSGPRCTRARKAMAAAARLGYRDLAEFSPGLSGWASVRGRTEGRLLPQAPCEVYTPAGLRAELARRGCDVLLDVRDADDFARFHLAGSRSLPLDALRARHAELPAGARVCLVDLLGSQAPTAARLLYLLGHTRLARLGGGLVAWGPSGLVFGPTGPTARR